MTGARCAKLLTDIFGWLAVGVYLWPASALSNANLLGVEIGTGFNESHGIEAVILRYRREAAPLLGRESFWDFSLAAWNGPYRNQAVGAGRGLRFHVREHTAFSASGGLAYITEARKDNHLSTHLQLVFRLAAEYRLGGTELSLAAVHYSNGRSLFGWNGPNTGENFATLQLAREF